jgi:hypothetical protein
VILPSGVLSHKSVANLSLAGVPRGVFRRFSSLLDSVSPAPNSDEAFIIVKFQQVRYLHEAVFRELDRVFTEQHVKIVPSGEQPFRFQFDSLLGIQDKNDLLPLDHVKNEQGRIFGVKIGFFEMVAVALCKVKASGIFLYARMKVIDDLLILEFLVLVVPEAVPVQPERYFSFGNDDFSEPPRHGLFHSRRIRDHQTRAKKLKSFLHTDLV